MNSYVLIASLITICSIFAARPTSAFAPWVAPSPPPLVHELSLNAFAGRWYQYGANFLATTFTEQSANCVTAEYTIKARRLNRGKRQTIMEVKNRSIRPVFGTRFDISGVAKTTNKPGILDLQFPNVPKGQYWIMAVGEKVLNRHTRKEEYAWSLVSTENSRYLFVLVRDLSKYNEYEHEIKEFLKKHGFDGPFSRAIPTKHKDCDYKWNEKRQRSRDEMPNSPPRARCLERDDESRGLDCIDE